MNKGIKSMLKKIRNKIFFYCTNSFKKKGSGNVIRYGKNCNFQNCHIYIRGDNNSIIFNNNCNMRGLHILIEGNNNQIIFGENVTVNASKIQPTIINAVGGKVISIGDGSLFSNNIEIHTTDYHGIYNQKGERINPDKDIIIGKHVWIGLGCKILKGTVILDDSIVGAGSLVSNVFNESNVVIVGNPAKIIKHHVFWKGKRADSYPVPNILKEKWDI